MPSTNELKPLLHPTGPRRWENWHHNVKQQTKRVIDVWNARPNRSDITVYNATTQGLQGLIEEALGSGDCVRGLGGGWSLSPVAATEGLLLNTRPLNFRFRINNEQTHPQYNGDAGNLLLVQCGTSIADLNLYLKNRGKSLKTSGASNGQTIAGALSTGTHGSAIDVGAVQEYVKAIHLIVGPNRAVWLERASSPVVDDALPHALNAEIIRDDDIFKAALVSFGNFGIIHGILLETTDLYYLQSYRKRRTLNDGLWKAIDGLDFTDVALPRPSDQRPYHFQVLINPFDLDAGVYVTVMYKDQVPAADCQPRDLNGKITQGDSAMEVVGALLDLASDLTPAVFKLLFRTITGEHDGVCGTHGEMFRDTSTRGRGAGTGMGIPLGRVRQAVHIVADLVSEYPAPILIALRYVRASDATLAFTCHQPYTCVLDIDGPQSRRVTTILRRVWRAFDDANIPYTFHWGKLNNLDAERVRTMYGDHKVESWLSARRQLLDTPDLRRLFANDFLKELRMDKPDTVTAPVV